MFPSKEISLNLYDLFATVINSHCLFSLNLISKSFFLSDSLRSEVSVPTVVISLISKSTIVKLNTIIDKEATGFGNKVAIIDTRDISFLESFSNADPKNAFNKIVKLTTRAGTSNYNSSSRVTSYMNNNHALHLDVYWVISAHYELTFCYYGGKWYYFIGY